MWSFLTRLMRLFLKWALVCWLCVVWFVGALMGVSLLHAGVFGPSCPGDIQPGEYCSYNTARGTVRVY